MQRIAASLVWLVVLTTGVAGPLYAHPFWPMDAGFWGGFLHPLHGMDHLLAMFAVGLLASQWRGRRALMLPATFVMLAAVGLVLGLTGLPLPYTDVMTLVSVLVLGLLVSIEPRLSLWVAVGIVALFGLFHGHAHGTELPGSAVPAGVGMIAATAMLHSVGLAAGLALREHRAVAMIRATGLAIVGAGIALPLL
jgi:urease accessory protein